MAFHIELVPRSDLPKRRDGLADEPDDVSAIHDAICDVLAEENAAEFVVTGFGTERWPVDIRFDLPILLPDVVKVLAALANGPVVGASLNFVEQGVERVVTIDADLEPLPLVCTSWTQWEPKPTTEFISRNALHLLLTRTLQTYFALATAVVPNMVEHPMFRDWVQSWSSALAQQ